ncbi:MAG TPA: dienelactone hydrolase family protein, partial [Thermoanaerobaculia bacterium]
LDWQRLKAPLLLIYGEMDKGVPASKGIELQKKLRAMGKDVAVAVYPGADHAFFNDTRTEVYNARAAEDAWRRTIELFRQHVR